MFFWKRDSSCSGPDSIISEIEDNEPWSDRALYSLLTLSRLAGRLSDQPPVAMVDLVAGRLFPALALETRFGCAVVDVANFQFETIKQLPFGSRSGKVQGLKAEFERPRRLRR